MRKHLNVVGAVIVHDGMVLCAQRGTAGTLGGYWEFPGGKIDPGETPRAALIREILEELGCVVSVDAELTTTTHAYDFGDVTLTTFWCELQSGTPTLLEHAQMRWLAPTELGTLDWAPADIPTVNLIASHPAARGGVD